MWSAFRFDYRFSVFGFLPILVVRFSMFDIRISTEHQSTNIESERRPHRHLQSSHIKSIHECSSEIS